MDFNDYRGQVLEEMSETNERVLKQFFFRIDYKGIVGYENSLSKNYLQFGQISQVFSLVKVGRT